MSAAADAVFFQRCRERVRALDPLALEGRVRASVGVVLEAEGIQAGVGSICRIETGGGSPVNPFPANAAVCR